MAYTPIRTVVVTTNQLRESSDLTTPLSSFAGKTAYLVVEKNKAPSVLDLGKILLLEQALDLTQPVGTVFTSRLTDLFVAKYRDDTIPITNDNGVYPNRLKVFSPLSYKDHKVQFTSIDTPTIVDDVTKKGYLDDLVITSKVDMSHYLVAVNGVFHRTSLFNGKLYVHDGFRTIRLSDREDITVVDTKDIGGHQIIPLTPDNVVQTTMNGLATITSPISLRNKTVFLVIDGYFYHVDSKVFYHADETRVNVYTNKLPLVDQLRHNPRTIYRLDRYGLNASQASRKYSDAYADRFLNSRTVPSTVFATRDFQYSRLTTYHSFLVVVDNPNLFSVVCDVLPTGTPQFYMDMADRIISGMMSYSAGLCPSYVIWRDPFRRQAIFVEKQDYDVGIYQESINPTFVSSPIEDIETARNRMVRFVDYVSA